MEKPTTKPAENNSPIIVGLDIGTTKIATIVGRKNEHGKIEILGYGKTESTGVQRGVVTNIVQTVQAIERSVNEAATKSKVQIFEVYVGIAGEHIKSLQHRGMRTRNTLEDEITQTDIDAIVEDMRKLAMPPGEKIIDIIPQEYTVDNERGIKDPIGMSGIRLEANCHIITGQITSIKNINKCVDRVHLKTKGLFLEPLASSEAVLTEEEKEHGVALVDIGGGTTDIAIFEDGIIRHTAVIPFGGNRVTEDIRMGCNIVRKHAEELKIKFGSALAKENDENEIVTIPGGIGKTPKEISLKTLAEIIMARMEEIIDMVMYEIKNSGYDKKLHAGIVVTGGGAQLNHIVQLIEYCTGMDARIGYPSEHLAGGADELKSPMYATGVGIVMKGFQDLECAKTAATKAVVATPEQNLTKTGIRVESSKPKQGILDEFMKWITNDEDDVELK
jgi:cell division protein FtsA